MLDKGFFMIDYKNFACRPLAICDKCDFRDHSKDIYGGVGASPGYPVDCLRCRITFKINKKEFDSLRNGHDRL